MLALVRHWPHGRTGIARITDDDLRARRDGNLLCSPSRCAGTSMREGAVHVWPELAIIWSTHA